MKFFDSVKKYWGMWLSFSVILIAALVFLVLGISTHEEPGFVDDRQWPSVPVAVSCHGYVAADEGACSKVEEVVRRINQRLGFVMLVYTAHAPAAPITVTMRAPVEVAVDEPGGHAELHGVAPVLSACVVETANASGGASDLELLVVYHELGHCLGLDHDDDARSGPLTLHSIMRPTVHATPDGVIPPHIDDWDRDLLRERYKP